MKPPPKILRPRYLPGPAAASQWLKTIHLFAPLGFLRFLAPRRVNVRVWPWPIGPFLVPYVWSFQICGWAVHLTFWGLIRLSCAIWNWVGLPIFIFAWYRRQDAKARRHGGQTVASALAATLPGSSHRQMTRHAVQALPAGPPLPPAPVPVASPDQPVVDIATGDLVVGPDGDVHLVQTLANGQQVITPLLPRWQQ